MANDSQGDLSLNFLPQTFKEKEEEIKRKKEEREERLKQRILSTKSKPVVKKRTTKNNDSHLQDLMELNNSSGSSAHTEAPTSASEPALKKKEGRQK